MVGFSCGGVGVRMFGAVFPAPSCAHFSPVRRTRQARVVVIFQGVLWLWWGLGVPGGLDRTSLGA